MGFGCSYFGIRSGNLGIGCGNLDIGCCLVVRVVASGTIDLGFESSHRQILYAINCFEKTKIK